MLTEERTVSGERGAYTVSPYEVISLTNMRSSGAELLLHQGAFVNVCSDVHSVVWEFRNAHLLPMPEQTGLEGAAIARYPLDRAPNEERDAIARLSSPEVYAALRRGARSQPRYPAVEDGALVSLCEEIRAAFVWKSLAVRDLLQENK
jgi:hypothetical protein